MGQRPGDRVVRRVGIEASTANPARWVMDARMPGMGKQTLPAVVRYGGTIVALAALTSILWPLREHIGLLNIGFLYLIVVIGATTFGGRWAGIVASVLGFALFDFFLVPPYLTFAINEQKDVFALFVFLGVSSLVSWLLAQAREQARQAQQRAEDLSRLYDLSQAITGARQPDEVLPEIAGKVVEVFGVGACWILLPDKHGQLAVSAQAPRVGRQPTRAEIGMAQWSFEHSSEVGQGSLSTPRFQGGSSRQVAAFVPLRAGNKTIGVLGVAGKEDGRPLTTAERTVLATFANQAAVALERLRLLREADRAEMLERTDKLKTALLSAVSHDLRTPLASIMASVTSLMERDIEWDRETQEEFLQQIYDEARRLNRLVGNLLDMSRIEGGALRPELDWYSIEEVAQAVAERLESIFSERALEVRVQDGMPLTLLDFSEIDQVLTNLLENAVKYTPPGTHVWLDVGQVGEDIEVKVADDGPGVASEHLSRLFDKFYRADGKDGGAGAGLGLAVSKGLVEAHGGHISARNRPGGGLEIAFTLPVVKDADRVGEDIGGERHARPA